MNKGGNKQEIIKYDYIKNNLLNDKKFIINNKLSFKYFNNDYELIYNILFDFIKPGKPSLKIKDFYNLFSNNSIKLLNKIKDKKNILKYCKNYIRIYDYENIDNSKFNNLNDFYNFIFNLINKIIFNNSFINLFDSNLLDTFIKNNNLSNQEINNSNIQDILYELLNYGRFFNDFYNNNDNNIIININNLLNNFFDLILNSNIYKYYDLIINPYDNFDNFFQLQEIYDDEDINKIFLNKKNQIELFYYLINFTYQLIFYSINDDGYIDNFNIKDLPALSMFSSDYILYNHYEDFILFIINKYKK